MVEVTSIFSGNAAIPYAAFNLRDDYYRESARFVINAAKARLGKKNLGAVVEIGAGIGISTMEILQHAERVIAVEPDEGMRYFLGLNTMGDPLVTIVGGRGETLLRSLHQVADLWTGVPGLQDEPFHESFNGVDTILCCQAFHLFNPPGKESLVPKVLEQVSCVLKKCGVFAFDLGPSNFKFLTRISDHRTFTNSGEILTELSHPLYQRTHQILYGVVKREYPDFTRENLWPLGSAKMTYDFLVQASLKAGLSSLLFTENFIPLNGLRVIEFIRNGWTVFFRWPPLSELSSEKKLALMNEAMTQLFREPDFEQMQNMMSYHPTAVFTAVKV
ncbi:MAG: class I SAM-dependent methyltransferase [Candidatus Sungbacteria bacterium]|nr:class I SAM-dependent methyltransferase [Candidatus Sungbacteria bacterium]